MKAKKLTKREAETLEYFMDSAHWRMIREHEAWPDGIMEDAIRDMWGGFWLVVPQSRLVSRIG